LPRATAGRLARGLPALTQPGSPLTCGKPIDRPGVVLAWRVGLRWPGEPGIIFRLRASDDIRVFYDVTGDAVQVLAIVPKSEAEAWLAKYGESNETGGSV
jgi:hypothetical protein